MERSQAQRDVQDLPRIGGIELADLVRVQDGVGRVEPLRSTAAPASEPILVERADAEQRCRERRDSKNGQGDREDSGWSKRHVENQWLRGE